MAWFAFAFCSAILSAAAAVIQKKILFRLSALEFSFLLSAAILLLSSFVPLFVDVTTIPRSQLLIIAAKSILGGSAFFLVMLSLEHNQISSALPILGITPAATALAALLLLGESVKSAEWGGIVLIIIGAYVLEKKEDETTSGILRDIFVSKNHAYIFASVGLFALSSVLDKMLVGRLGVEPLVVLFYQHIVYVFIFGLGLLLKKSSVRQAIKKGKPYIPVILGVAALTIAYRFSQLEATKDAPVALVLAVKRTSILFATLFGGRMFSEDRLRMKLIGGALIVASGFIILRNVG